MEERRHEARHRTLRSGKIIFNDRCSVVDCLVRNLSDSGACLQVNTGFGVPPSFDLRIDGTDTDVAADMVWATQNRIGVAFRVSAAKDAATDAAPTAHAEAADGRGGDVVRGELLALRAALDEIDTGVVLLDAQTRAQFINRAFRRMWRLPEEKADSRLPFVALMYHGRDTRAYAIRVDEIDSYVAQRVAHVKAGDPKPLDLRLANGEVLRMQCTVLPGGGRMLCYTYVTDIVSHSDELEVLRSALDHVQQGVIILDSFLNVQFMNRAVRELWNIPDEQAARHPSFVEIASNARMGSAVNVPAEEFGDYVAGRIAVVRAGDPTPIDIPHADGRIIRSQCAALPNGGRMLTYTDVTDLVSRADRVEHVAMVDSMTGARNRRQFDALAAVEWSRFQRYQRPLALLLVDIDHFKLTNDRYGRETGDRAIAHVAALCAEEKRTADIVARIGGDEFAVLLPEADLSQAGIVAERLRQRIAQRPLPRQGQTAGDVALTVSIGLAAATLSMSGTEALMKVADHGLYRAKAAGRNCVMSGGRLHEAPPRAAAE